MSIDVRQRCKVKAPLFTFDERIRVGDRCFVYDAIRIGGQRVLVISFPGVPRSREPDKSHFEYICESRGVENYLEAIK